MSDKARKYIGVGLFLVAAVAMAWPFVGGGVGIPGISPSPAVTSVTYVYEKDDGGVPSGVGLGLSKLNEQGILATDVDDDVTNPSGAIPKQYALIIPAARTAGLPALVAMAGDEVRSITLKPTTEQQVLEAAK